MQKLRIKKFQVWRSLNNKEYYMRIIGLNGRTVGGAGEGFRSRAGRNNAVAIINQSLIKAVPVELMEWKTVIKKGQPFEVLVPVKEPAKVSAKKRSAKA